MTTATEQKAVRLPNDQINTLIPALPVEISFGGNVLGSVTAPQEELLSKSGNVLFRGAIKRGWKLPGEVSEALTALAFIVNGVAASVASTGLTKSAPRKRRDGSTIPNTGGEPMISHFAMVPVADGVEYMVNIRVKKLHAKAGVDQGYSLSISGIPRGEGFGAGVQVIGEVEGLVVE